MTRLRIALLSAGVLGGLYGAYRLLDLGWANTKATLTWLIGGVVLHDGVFAGLTMVVALVALRLVRPDRLAPWVVGLVILVPTTLLAIPELGRFGARADNPTLLDRHYWLGLWAVVVVVVAAILVTTYAGRRRVHVEPDEGGDDGQGAGGG
jgi:hypothetical protein